MILLFLVLFASALVIGVVGLFAATGQIAHWCARLLIRVAVVILGEGLLGLFASLAVRVVVGGKPFRVDAGRYYVIEKRQEREVPKAAYELVEATEKASNALNGYLWIGIVALSIGGAVNASTKKTANEIRADGQP